MKIGALSAAWADKPIEEVLDFFAANGLEAVELGTGNYPPDAHCDPVVLNKSKAKRDALLKLVESRGMEISALSCHGNPLHPDAKTAGEHHEVFRQTVLLAKKLGVSCVNGFAGLPAGGPDDKVPNWVTAPWPDDHLDALKYQWGVTTKYWRKQNTYLNKHGIDMCFEMHPNFLVYNPETLVKLREACGERMCANYDPSHLFWQGIDNSAAIRWLQSRGDIIKHFHAKDSKVYEHNARVNGVLDTKHYGDEPNRSWLFRTVGYGNSEAVWNDMISTLRMCGYDGVLSIEHEDSLMTNDEGFLKAVALLKNAVISAGAPTSMPWAERSEE